MKRVEILGKELDYLRETNPAEVRIKELGHPKELHEKLYQACLSVKTTHESLPKLVDRMEQKRKVHEVCAKVMLGIAELETQ